MVSAPFDVSDDAPITDSPARCSLNTVEAMVQQAHHTVVTVTCRELVERSMNSPLTTPSNRHPMTSKIRFLGNGAGKVYP